MSDLVEQLLALRAGLEAWVMFEDVADEVEQPDEAVVLHSVMPRLQVLPLDDGPVHPTSQTLQIYHFCNIKFNWLEDIRFFKMKVKNELSR